MKKTEALSKFKDAMDRLNFPRKTMSSYLYMTGRFFDYCTTKKLSTTREYLDNFFLTLKFQGRPCTTINLYICAIRKYFILVQKKSIEISEIPYMKKERKIPKIMSLDDIHKMFSTEINPKHKLLLALAYGCGLRVSEVVSVRNKDIYLDRGLMRIFGKGRKERLVSINDIPEGLIKTYMYGEYLFPGQFGGHLSVRSAQKIFEYACWRAGITKQTGFHGLRHSFATHSLEQGTDIRFIQKILGHSSIKTTMIYTSVADEHLTKIKSPIVGCL